MDGYGVAYAPTHHENKLLAIPEARSIFVIVKGNFAEIELLNGALEVLVSNDEDRGAELDGVECVVVEWEDDGAAAADVATLLVDVNVQLDTCAVCSVLEEKRSRGTTSTCADDGDLVGDDVGGKTGRGGGIEPVEDAEGGAGRDGEGGRKQGEPESAHFWTVDVYEGKLAS